MDMSFVKKIINLWANSSADAEGKLEYRKRLISIIIGYCFDFVCMNRTLVTFSCRGASCSVCGK